MKTYHLKDLLKRELLIIELHERIADFSVLNTGDAIAVCAFDEYDNCLDVKGITVDYTLLGKPDEIKEEDAMELVESQTFGKDNISYMDYKLSKRNVRLFGRTAKESLLSAIESEIYWDVNPLKYWFENADKIDDENEAITKKQFEEAQEKTFNRNRTLIFVKN